MAEWEEEFEEDDDTSLEEQTAVPLASEPDTTVEQPTGEQGGPVGRKAAVSGRCAARRVFVTPS